MTLTATQETTTTTSAATVDLRFYAGVAWEDLTLTDYTLRSLPDGWVDADTPAAGWTEVTDRVHWNGTLTSERDGNAVRVSLNLRGEDYDSDYFGLDQTIVVLDRIIVDGVTLYDWGLWYLGMVVAGDNGDDYRHGGAWSRELRGLDAALALANAPRMTAGLINIAEGATARASSTLALASLEVGNGEFVGTTVDVSADNVTDENIDTVWISANIPSVVGEEPVASVSPHLVIDKVFISPVAGFGGFWWFELYNQVGADAVQLASIGYAWYFRNEAGMYLDMHVAEGTYGLDAGDRGIVCSDRALFDAYTGGAPDAAWIIEAKSWRKRGDGFPGREMDGSAFNLSASDGRIELWSYPYVIPVDVVCWNETGADPAVIGWLGSAINISTMPTGEAIRRYPSGTDTNAAGDWRFDPNYEPGGHTEPNSVEWIEITLPENATTLTGAYTIGETVLTLSDTRGWPEPTAEIASFSGYLEGEVFTYTGRSTSGLTGVDGLTLDHAENALVYPYVLGRIMDGWPCSEIKLIRREGAKSDGSALPVLQDFEVRIQKTGYYATPDTPPTVNWEQEWDSQHWFTRKNNTQAIVSFPMMGANEQGFRWVRRILIIIQEMSDTGRAKLNEVWVKLAQTEVNGSGDGDIGGATSGGLAEYLIGTVPGLSSGAFVDQTAATTHGVIGSHSTAIAPYTRVLEDLARVTGCVARYNRAGGLNWRLDPWWPTGAATYFLAPTGRLGSEHVRGEVTFQHQKPTIVGVVVRARSVDGTEQFKAVWPPGAEASGPVREFDDYVVGSEADAHYLAQALWYREGLHYRETGGAHQAKLTIKGVGEWCGVDQWIELMASDQYGRLYPAEGVWLLKDGYTTALAAGSVDETYAEPGPGVRSVTDTADHVSIVGGELDFDGGTSAWGDPGIWYPVQTRAAGRVLTASATVSTTGTGAKVGWDTDTAGDINAASIYFGAGNLYERCNAASLVVGSYADATEYDVAVVLRTAGAFVLIHGGIYTKWHLVWIDSTEATASLYPGITTYSQAFTVDDLHIPDELWLPTPLAADTFTQIDGVLGNSEATGPDGQTATVRAWTGATWETASNVAINTPTLGAELSSGTLTIGTWYSITATQTDHFFTGCAVGNTFRATAATGLDANNKVKAITLATLLASQEYATQNVILDVTLPAYTAGTQAGLVARLDSASSPAKFIIVNQGATVVKLDECVAGVYTNKLNVASAYAASDVLRLILSGTAYLAYKITSAGVATLLGSGTTTVTSGLLHGMFSTDVTNTLDNYTCWPRGTEGQYQELMSPGTLNNEGTTSWLTERVSHEFRTERGQRQWACKVDMKRFMR